MTETQDDASPTLIPNQPLTGGANHRLSSRSPNRRKKRSISVLATTPTRSRRKTSSDKEVSMEQWMVERAEERAERELRLREHEQRMDEREQERRADKAKRREMAEQKEARRQLRSDDKNSRMMMTMMAMVSGNKRGYKKNKHDHDKDGSDDDGDSDSN